MIIECINCNKKFNIDSILIPSSGRKIQCGSCKYIWFYKEEEKITKPLIIDKKINQVNKDLINKQKNIGIIEQNITIGTNDKNFQNQSEQKVENTSIAKFFSYLIVFIISLISLIILVDTIKIPLVNKFPNLEIILFNLFETLKDIKLFIIDLT